MARQGAKTEPDPAAQPEPGSDPPEPETVGPPLLLLGTGFLSVLVSVPFVFADGIPAHAFGYVFGSLIPILLVGLVRRADLDRRRSHLYQERSFLRPALAVLAVTALVAAGLHIWPIATELSK